MKQSKDIEILNENIIRGMLKMMVPLILLSMMNTMYSLVDTFWVGRMGELQVGAISLVSPIMECGNAFCTGLSAATMALIGRQIGAGKYDRAKEIASVLFKLTIILGVGLGVLFIVFNQTLLRWMNTPDNLFEDASSYLFGISFDFLFLFMMNIFHAYRSSMADTRTGVKYNLIASVLNMILDPILIFGLRLNVLGAALATVLSKMAMMPFIIHKLKDKNEIITVDLRSRMKWNRLSKICNVALPASTSEFISSFGFVIMNRYIVSYGAIAMSAYGIGNRISSLFFIPMYAVGSCLSIYVAQNLGNNNRKRCEESFKKSLILIIIIAISGTFIGFICAKQCILMFIKDISDEMMHYSLEYTYYSIGTGIFMGWYSALTGVFNGSGHTKYSLILSTVRLWCIRIPLIIIFSKFTTFGPTGIWVAMVLSNIVICITGQIIYQRKSWQY